MSGISLTASMRSNLLSLQNISGQVSSTQNKLATGNKVNSAIDNPGSYYTALSLNNRADDLNALLDSMGQAVSTIKAATTALESAAGFLEQASAVATQALETAKVPSKEQLQNMVGENGAVVSTAQELKDAVAAGKETICVYGTIDYFENESLTLQEGQKLVGTEYFTGYTGQEKFSQINFKSNVSSMAAINMENSSLVSDLKLFYNNTEETGGGSLLRLMGKKEATVSNVECELKRATVGNNGSAQAVIKTSDGAILNISGHNRLEASGHYVSGVYAFTSATVNFLSGSTTDIILPDSERIDGSNNGGYGIYTWSNSTTNIAKGSVVNIKSNARGGIGLLKQSTVNIEGNVNMDIYHFDGDSRNYPIVLWNYQNYDNNLLNISSSAVLNIKSNTDVWFANVAYSGDVGPSRINISNGATINGYYENKEYNFISTGYTYANDTKADQHLSFTTLDTINGFQKTTGTSSINWDKIVGDRAEEDGKEKTSAQYQEIINQYDSLIKDASYKGINLLQNDKLSVKFNEDSTASLDVQGKDMSSKALGFTVFDWQTQGDIAESLSEIASALKSIRNYSSELGNNYSIITTRQDFTESLVNVLTEGADKLTLADMNEESANMLALQTRQQLAINSLSLASQASQSILKLF